MKEEIERLKQAPAETITRVVYKPPEELGKDHLNSLLNFSGAEGDELTKVGTFHHSSKESLPSRTMSWVGKNE